MALLTVTSINKAGVDQAAAAVAADAAGDSVVASSGLFVEVTNGDASPHTATVAAPVATATCDPYGSLTVSAIAIVVPAGETRSFTIPAGYSSSNLFEWTYDDVTSVSVAVFSLA